MKELRWPEGTVVRKPVGGTVLCALRAADPVRAGAAVAGSVDGRLVDLRSTVGADDVVDIVTLESPQAGEVIRHSAEHVMADAVKRLWPEVQIDVGRTDHSEKFQYDFRMPRPFTPDDLTRIQSKMEEILREDSEFTRQTLDRGSARDLFAGMGEHLKVLRLDDIAKGEEVTVFRHGTFTDMCRGPHVQRASQIGAVKLLEASASHLRGDEKGEVLQRIYGTAFATKADLEAYLERIEEARQRDHRRIGKELDLFSISEDVGPGLILWHPKGARIRSAIEDFWRREHVKAGYEPVYSPHVAREELWETSGHTGFYRDNMYSPMDVEGQRYLVKPMNCPFHIQIYRSALRSYRDLPLKYSELGTVYRYERSGVLHGLLRVRGFTQDDAHLFVRPDQLNEEIRKVLDFAVYIFKTFGFFGYDIFLSTRPGKSVGSDEDWEQATAALVGALEATGLKYEVDPGEGVFYGPKIDLKVRDSLGRSWQCSTIQVDFALPARFHLEFVDRDGTRRAPIMVHRALFGSMERFFGCLVEHYRGAFPFWLAPVQAVLIPITDGQAEFAGEVALRLRNEGFRVEVDGRNEKLGFKVREAQVAKVPLMVILGAKEMERREVSLRRRSGEQESMLSVERLIEVFRTEDGSR